MRIFALLLNVYRRYRRWRLRRQGLTEDDVSYNRVSQGQAWDDFCEQLKGAGAAIMQGGSPMDPLTQAEGYRYLSRLVRGALEVFVEASDPLRPKFVSVVNGHRDAPVKLGSDSPDNLYQNAVIDGRLTYRVRGSRGTVPYLGFGVQAGQYGAPGGFRTVAYVEAQDFVPAEDGGIDFILGPRRPEGATNFIETSVEPPEGQLMVRQTFVRREEEVPAVLSIELVGPPEGGLSGDFLTPRHMDEGLHKTGLLVAGAPLMFNSWVASFQNHVNALPLFDPERSTKAGGDPNIRYYHSYWRLLPGEALVIDAVPPACDNWNCTR